TELLLAEHAAGRLIEAGRVDGPLHHRVQRWLQDRAAQLATADPPADVRGGRWTTWLRAVLCATVAHAGRDGDGTLRDVSLIALRDDIDPDFCIRRSAVPPPLD